MTMSAMPICLQAQKTSGQPARLSVAQFPASLEEYVQRQVHKAC
jgi:hypothetical protein